MDKLPKPTNKVSEIEDLITDLTPNKTSRQEAYNKSICTWCNKPITEFRDSLSKKEYSISGLCQQCQDDTFGI